MQILGILHDTDAPVEVGRKPVLQVVWMFQCQFPTGEESLMAYQHSFLEAFPMQYIGCLKAPHVQKMSFFIYNGSLAINHIGYFLAFQCNYHPL